jgi:hypothetical protein
MSENDKKRVLVYVIGRINGYPIIIVTIDNSGNNLHKLLNEYTYTNISNEKQTLTNSPNVSEILFNNYTINNLNDVFDNKDSLRIAQGSSFNIIEFRDKIDCGELLKILNKLGNTIDCRQNFYSSLKDNATKQLFNELFFAQCDKLNISCSNCISLDYDTNNNVNKNNINNNDNVKPNVNNNVLPPPTISDNIFRIVGRLFFSSNPVLGSNRYNNKWI